KDPKKPDCYLRIAVITLADANYFSPSATDESQDADSCEFVALFKAADSVFPAMDYDYDTGTGGTNVKTMWDSYEGTIEFDAKFIDPVAEPECFNLDPFYFPS